MAKKAAGTTTLKEIEDAILAEATAFYQAFRKRHANEVVYGYLFEVSATGYAVAAAIATEEALTRHAEESADSFDGDVEQAMTELRWAGPEDGWYQSEDKHFWTSNKLLDLAEQRELYPAYDGTLEKLALSVIKQMEAAQTFGSPDEREKMVLGICYTGGDNSEKEFIAWAAQVNSPKVMKRLKAQLKQRG